MRPDITSKMLEEPPLIEEAEKEMLKQSERIIETSIFTSQKKPLINRTSTKFDSADYEMERQAYAKVVEIQNELVLRSEKPKRKQPLIKKDFVKRFDSATHEMEKIGMNL